MKLKVTIPSPSQTDEQARAVRCSSCSGSGYYDVAGSPACQSCSGTGRCDLVLVSELPWTLQDLSAGDVRELVRAMGRDLVASKNGPAVERDLLPDLVELAEPIEQDEEY